MAIKRGRCRRFGACHFADDRKVLEVDDSSFVCPNPECGRPLAAIIETKQGGTGLPLSAIVGGVVGLLAVGGLAYWVVQFYERPPTIPPKPAADWVTQLNIPR